MNGSSFVIPGFTARFYKPRRNAKREEKKYQKKLFLYQPQPVKSMNKIIMEHNIGRGRFLPNMVKVTALPGTDGEKF